MRGIGAFVPFNGQRQQRLLRAPEIIGNDRDRVFTNGVYGFYAALADTILASKLFSLPPNTGQALIAANIMSGSRISTP